MSRNRRAVVLAAETVRDIGILVFVFGPLDAFFQATRPAAGVAGSLAALGLSLIGVAIIIEARMEGSR